VSIINVKQFRSFCRFTSIILKLFTIWIGIAISVSLYSYFFTDTDIWFNFSAPGFTLVNGQRGTLADSEKHLAALIIVPIGAIVSSYVFWKGGQLFNYLAEGNSPFSYDFSRTVKRISLILIVTDILSPLIYSLLVTTIMAGSYYYIIGLGAPFLIGLILFAVSEIFNYAINLQQVVDDTV